MRDYLDENDASKGLAVMKKQWLQVERLTDVSVDLYGN